MKNILIFILISINIQANELDDTIINVSKEFKLNPIFLYKIAIVESSLNVSVRPQYNKNGTVDIGVFQINSIHQRNKCKKYNIEILRGNARCAATLIKMHKKKSLVDKYWLARYHSKTKRHKMRYWKHLKKAEKFLKKTKGL